MPGTSYCFKKKKKSLYFNPVSMIWTQARLHWALFGPAKPHPSQVAPLSRLLTFAHPYFLGAVPTGVALLAGVRDWHRRQGCWREDPLVAAPSAVTQTRALHGVSVLSFNVVS